MHELALMTTVVGRACEIAAANGAARVTGITLACGELSGVVPDALEFCFDVCTADTAAAGARLVIEQVPAVWRCAACHAAIADLDDGSADCPSCHSGPIELEQGRDFHLASIMVE